MHATLRVVVRRFPSVPGLAIGLLTAAVAAAQPTVWTGPTITFTKPPFASPFPEDQLTANVAFTRGDTAGLYNAAQELSYAGTSPADTAWATSLNNPGGTISATNWAALDFTTWVSAYGGPNNLAFEITQRDAVVHLVTNDIYLDLRFTEWGVGFGGGGSFSYNRSTPPDMPAPTGDYNDDGIVDAADYVLWRKTLGQPADPPGSGADGNANGTIDAGDYDFWRERFGNVVSGSGAGALAVPEPAAVVLILTGLIGLSGIAFRRTPRAKI